MTRKNVNTSFVRSLLPWGLVLALSACGGGGGSADVGGVAPPVVPPEPTVPVNPPEPTAPPSPVVDSQPSVGIQAENEQYRIVYTTTDSANSLASSAELEWVQRPELGSQLTASVSYSMTLDEAPLIAPYSGSTPVR